MGCQSVIYNLHKDREIYTSYRNTQKAIMLWVNRPMLAATEQRLEMLHSKCDLFRKGWMWSSLNAQSSVPLHLYFSGTEGGAIRLTPHLWERKKSKCLAELKALLLVRTLEAAALQGSLHVSPQFTHSRWPQNQFPH